MFVKLLKNILTLMIALSAVFVMTVTASAEAADKVVDNANILTDSEESGLEKDILEIIKKYGSKYDITVVTTYGTGGKSIEAFADDLYDNSDYGYGPEHSGVILAVDMQSRSYYISTYGKCITVFTDHGIGYMEDEFLSYLSDGDYAEAFRKYADSAEMLIEYYESNGEAYDVSTYSQDVSVNLKRPRYAFYFLCALIFGCIIAFAVCMGLKGQLKSVNIQTNASNYVRQGSFHVTNSRDTFLYRTVSKVKRETSSSSGGSSSSSRHSGGSTTHRSSSGRTHGGHGGRF